MVSLYFGLPGAGKTTLLSSMAYKELHRRKKKYAHVYGNVDLAIDGYVKIDNNCIGVYQLENCLILIDEASIFADSRDYKSFGKHLVQFFLLHRHYHCDICLFTQGYNRVDKTIRSICDRVYFMYKPPFTGCWITKYYRIPYGIIIPDAKTMSNSPKLGEIVEGYSKPPLLVRLFCPRLFRPRWYRYFDSWEMPPLPKLPPNYKPYQTPARPSLMQRIITAIAMRWFAYKVRLMAKKQAKAARKQDQL